MGRLRCFPVLLFFMLTGFSPVYGVPPLSGISAQDARSKLLAAAEQYRGIPYRYGGDDRRGMDCSGLIFRSFDDALGIRTPRTVGGIYYWAEKISLNAYAPGDLLFFNTTGGVSHVGIYMGEGRFIHSASDGPRTGVIVSSLGESYWRRTYIGAGRILPPGGDGQGLSGDAARLQGEARSGASGTGEGRFTAVMAVAPVWGGSDGPIRGAVGLGSLSLGLRVFNHDLDPALELRPQWDGKLGVSRIALTLSLALGGHFRLFAGPALTIGSPSLSYDGEDRLYSSGTVWINEAGLTMIPFTVETARGSFSLFGELAWQSYTPEGANFKFGPDLGASLRFSTGLRYARKL
jgi:probable lipoprotein NlpC